MPKIARDMACPQTSQVQEASRKLPAGKVRRAKIILLSSQGYTATEIADKLDWECAGSTLRPLEGVSEL